MQKLLNIESFCQKKKMKTKKNKEIGYCWK
jgi:hypothetical protein